MVAGVTLGMHGGHGRCSGNNFITCGGHIIGIIIVIIITCTATIIT
jgi:hypothetical protein